MATYRQSRWAATSTHNTPEYRRTRSIVRERDMMCIRCWTLHNRIVTHNLECDHYIPISKGGTDDTTNCWLLCKDCHSEKTQRESHNQTGWKPRINMDTGFDQREPDWQMIIEDRQRDYDAR